MKVLRGMKFDWIVGAAAVVVALSVQARRWKCWRQIFWIFLVCLLSMLLQKYAILRVV